MRRTASCCRSATTSSVHRNRLPRASPNRSMPYMALSAAVVYRSIWPHAEQTAVASDSQTSTERPYEARLVRSTACLWDGNSMGSHEIGSGLASGESLHLLEGLAEFKLNWAVSGRAT